MKKIINGDCLKVMQEMDDNSVDLILTDPPYFKVKNLAWDYQWEKPHNFLEWVAIILSEFERILKPNGSLYFFCSPQMAWGVEGEIRKKFNVLNNIRWKKDGKSRHQRKEDQRIFFPDSETIIFAEQFGVESMAKGVTGYETKCDELRGFVFEPIRSYLDGERLRAGVGKKEIDQKWATERGNKGGMSSHWFSQSQWVLPTEANYEWLRASLSNLNSQGEYLRKEYEYLRKEYEELRKDYEELRRPFSVRKGVPTTDIWTYKTVSNYPGKHLCEKPIKMMRDIINASSKPGAVVFDPFCGSGVVGQAAVETGRNFILVDMQERWCKRADLRIRQAEATIFETIT